MTKVVQVPVLLALGLLSGCACVTITPEEAARIDALHARGITWSQEWKAGRFTPPVNMTAAVWWSVLPGAGQHFMAHKMGDAGLDAEHADDCLRLRTSGTLMLATSWFPYVYVFTLPCGLAAGTVQDVNRINNLALLRYMDAQKRDNEKGMVSCPARLR